MTYESWIYEQLEPDSVTHARHHHYTTEREHRAAHDRELLEKYGPEELQRQDREFNEWEANRNRDDV